MIFKAVQQELYLEQAQEWNNLEQQYLKMPQKEKAQEVVEGIDNFSNSSLNFHVGVGDGVRMKQQYAVMDDNKVQKQNMKNK